MSNVVFIPTRNRLDMLVKTLPKWLAQEKISDIVVWTEPHELSMHKEFVADMSPKIHVASTKVSKGIGHKRNRMLKQADKWGLRNVIICDDDLAPSPKTDASILLRDIKKYPTIGLGACSSFYGLMLGNDRIRDTNRAYLVPGGMGYGMYALDVDLALEAGNFDCRLHTFWEDAELICQAMKKMGLAWHVHTGVWFSSLNKRNAPGGLSDWGAGKREEKEQQCHEIVFKEWGERYISQPGKQPRRRWRNFLDDFVKGWKRRAVWL